MKELKITIFLLGFSIPILFSQSAQHLEYVKKHPHEDIKIEYQHIPDKGIKHGLYRMYYRGVKLVEGKYVAGKKHGKWKRYFMDGKVASAAFYLQGVKHGTWKYYYKNGQLQASITFERGKKVGLWKSWFYDGNIACEQNYSNDTLLGKQAIYYSRKELDFNVSPPVAQLITDISYDDQGAMFEIEKYYRNGKVFQKYGWRNDHFVGMFNSWYLSGLPWMKVKYEEDGRLFSIYDYNNPVGRDANKGSFRDGDGELITYHSNGDKFSRIAYSNGLPDGAITIYEEDEKILVTGYYNDGDEVGTWRYYKSRTSKSELVKEINYIGRDSAVMTQFVGDGKARSEGEVFNQFKHGLWRSYHPLGDIESEIEYEHGFKHGITKWYREMEAIDLSGVFTYGLKTGKWKYYNDFGKVIFTEDYITQININPGYLLSDSCTSVNRLESSFYNISSNERVDFKRLLFTGREDYHMNFYHYLFDGRYSSRGKETRELMPEFEGYTEDFAPLFPQFVPWDFKKRDEVVKDYDLGVFLESLNPRKLKVKGDKKSPKIGVAMVVLDIDEFGFVERTRIVRGIHPEWDEKIKNLFNDFCFWEPAQINHIPIATSLQRKIPIELRVVKKME
jgi:antitoxin component YwqK of YwqJK toxin-antitoxin module